jgi:predicted RNase H-like HicB family nuclease
MGQSAEASFHVTYSSDMADILKFTAVYEQAEDGWVYAHVPELPEVHTQGRDLDEARAMVEDAIQLVIADRRERGEPIPETGWALAETIDVAA